MLKCTQSEVVPSFNLVMGGMICTQIGALGQRMAVTYYEEIMYPYTYSLHSNVIEYLPYIQHRCASVSEVV